MQNIKINKKTGNVNIGTNCIEPTLKYNAELLLKALNRKDKEIVVGIYDNMTEEIQPNMNYLFYNNWRYFKEIIDQVLIVVGGQTKYNTVPTGLSKARVKEIEIEVNKNLNYFVENKSWEKVLRKGESFPNKI